MWAAAWADDVHLWQRVTLPYFVLSTVPAIASAASTSDPAVRARHSIPFSQAKWSKIDFNYLEYAGVRWGEYHRRKAEFLARAAAAAAATVGRSDSTVTRS